jgi:hypothetical protein
MGSILEGKEFKQDHHLLPERCGNLGTNTFTHDGRAIDKIGKYRNQELRAQREKEAKGKFIPVFILLLS